jgi:hypothetical protein
MTAMRFALPVHEASAERALGLEPIVRAAAQAEVGDGALASARDLADMVELDDPRVAAEPVLADEGAAPAVTLPDLAFHARGDVARVGDGSWRTHGASDRAVLALPELRHEQFQRAIEHRCDSLESVT